MACGQRLVSGRRRRGRRASACDQNIERVINPPVSRCFHSHSALSESSLTTDGEAAGSQHAPRLCVGGAAAMAFPGPAAGGGASRTVVTVPGATLRDIRLYREDFDAYLRLVAHEPVGSFNPWAIADR